MLDMCDVWELRSGDIEEGEEGVIAWDHFEIGVFWGRVVD